MEIHGLRFAQAIGSGLHQETVVSPGRTRTAKSCPASILRELEAVAARLSIPVRYEKGDMRGGLCRLRGCTQIIINADLPVDEKADLLAESLAQANLGDVYLTPRARRLIEHLTDHRS